MSPTFTIAIPVYERLFGFEEALRSALAVKECSEILVVDNHSSHCGFESICIEQQDSRIRYFRNDKNLGLYGNFNQCAAFASGTFLAILGSDDIVDPFIYQRFLRAYENTPNVDVFFGCFASFTNSYESYTVERIYPQGRISCQQFLEDAVSVGIKFPQLYVVRTDRLCRFPFMTEPKGGNDWLWIYTNASRFILYSVADPLSYWRRHAVQDSNGSPAITDAFPLIYSNIAEQLMKCKSRLVSAANRRAVGVILSWLINSRSQNGYWSLRLLGEDGIYNPFLAKAKEIADRHWLLHQLLYAKSTWPIYYYLGRVLRKLKIYKGSLSGDKRVIQIKQGAFFQTAKNGVAENI